LHYHFGGRNPSAGFILYRATQRAARVLRVKVLNVR
jgi:hypothetical protein